MRSYISFITDCPSCVSRSPSWAERQGGHGCATDDLSAVPASPPPSFDDPCSLTTLADILSPPDPHHLLAAVPALERRSQCLHGCLQTVLRGRKGEGETGVASTYAALEHSSSRHSLYEPRAATLPGSRDATSPSDWTTRSTHSSPPTPPGSGSASRTTSRSPGSSAHRSTPRAGSRRKASGSEPMCTRLLLTLCVAGAFLLSMSSPAAAASPTRSAERAVEREILARWPWLKAYGGLTVDASCKRLTARRFRCRWDSSHVDSDGDEVAIWGQARVTRLRVYDARLYGVRCAPQSSSNCDSL
jgi:hypothetical protein